MKILDINNYSHIPKKRTEKPTGEVLPINWWQYCEDVDMLCICCLHRWREPVARSMLLRPEWMGDIRCPDQACGIVGMVVRG